MTTETETKKKITRPRIDDKKFVKAWMDAHKNGGSQMDVAAAVGCTPAGVSSKHKKLTESGVDLPELKAGSRKAKVNVDELNELIKSAK